jgi:hypothetical protein
MSVHCKIGGAFFFGIVSAALASGSAVAGSPAVRSFDAPGAGNTAGTQQGTLGVGINSLGVVADSGNMEYGSDE